MQSQMSDKQIDVLLNELKECEGPCGKLCLHCPAAYMIQEIIDVIDSLRCERNFFREMNVTYLGNQ